MLKINISIYNVIININNLKINLFSFRYILIKKQIADGLIKALIRKKFLIFYYVLSSE